MHAARSLLVKQQTMLANAMRGLATEFGITVPKGIRKLDELAVLVHADEIIPKQAKQAITGLHYYCNDLSEEIETFEAEIVAHARHDETVRRLATISGIGPITASLIAATVVDISLFKTARQFAAWLGLVPRQNSTGGKTRLGRITKTGNREIRKLLVLGATSMAYRADGWNSAVGGWLRNILERRPVRLVTVALANKMARIAWAVMTRKEVYRPKEVSRSQRKRPRDASPLDGRQRAQARLIRQEALNRVMGKTVVKNSSGNTVSSLVPRARPTDWCLTRMRTHDGQRHVPRDRPDIRAQLTGSFTDVDQRLNAIALVTRHGISSPDARTTTPRRSRRDPRRAIRGLQGAAQGYCRGCADEAGGCPIPSACRSAQSTGTVG